MLKTTDIREWIASLGIAEDEHVYMGKLDNKQQKSIGVYSRNSSGPPNIALGGLDYTSYDVRPISLLVHWNRSKPESEAAYELFETMQSSVTRSKTSITKSLPASFKPSIFTLFSESYNKIHCFKA